MKFAVQTLFAISCMGFVFIGCSPSNTADAPKATAESSDHDHEHEHPDNLKDAVKTLSDLYAKIKPAFESNDPEAAHDDLHEVAHLLDEAFPELIKNDAALSEDSKATLEGAISVLFDEFTKLDGVLHDGPEVEFAAVDANISSALEELSAAVPQ